VELVIVTVVVNIFRFGVFLGLAHAAMTAEGDKYVLMQKVAEEYLGYLAKNPPKLTKPTSLDDPAYLHYLLHARKVNLFTSLVQSWLHLLSW
jgi:acyl-CoA oxidase